MTRILYIPTGEFLRYGCNFLTPGTPAQGIPGPWYSETNIDNLYMTPEEEILTITNFTKDQFILHNGWMKENKLKFPILREELEIIYD